MLSFFLKYLSITVPIILTGMGLPVPEELLVIGAGIASNAGTVEPWTALVACLVGAVAGDCVSYAIGYHFGRALLRDRHWFSRLLTVEREQNVERMFQRHGLKAFLLARFLIGLRSPIYMTAGILRISFRWFLLADAISAGLVVSVFFWLSYFFAAGFQQLWLKFRGVEIALTVAVVLAAGIAAYFFWRHQKKSDAGNVGNAGAGRRDGTERAVVSSSRTDGPEIVTTSAQPAAGIGPKSSAGRATPAARPKSVA